MLDDEASYIPRLLLHSAISFERLNDKENSINFYKTLIDTYPSSKESKKASKILKKLN
jgi:TolA-binding protein